MSIGACGTSLIRADPADPKELDSQINERVLAVPIGGDDPAILEVTYFKPPGPGPFPLAVLNHGKGDVEPKQEARYRSPYLAHYFVSRGYAVALPMLRGYAGSGGISWTRGCDPAREALLQAEDIHSMIY